MGLGKFRNITCVKMGAMPITGTCHKARCGAWQVKGHATRKDGELGKYRDMPQGNKGCLTSSGTYHKVRRGVWQVQGHVTR